MTRPKIEDARNKMYRVRVNDEEEDMLKYICEKRTQEQIRCFSCSSKRSLWKTKNERI